MQIAENINLAEELMLDFARTTGLRPWGEHPRRYLWTDAFAVCNFLELFRRTNDDSFRALAVELIDQVHQVLGRHREDDPRRGWISGMSEEEGRLHPTAGGLRIGKERNERGAGQLADPRLEWEQDGQYYHYLTKWMHALERAGRVTEEARYIVWAVELAKTADSAFTRSPAPGRRAMHWKMSIDLSRPLVASMGQHDPLDGLVTCLELRAAAGLAPRQPGLDLGADIADLRALSDQVSWVTDDPLGIGGLLTDAFRVAQLVAEGDRGQIGLLVAILEAAVPSLEAFAAGGSLHLPISYRLAFRELGLSIGLRGLERLNALTRREDDQLFLDPRSNELLGQLLAYVPMAGEIERQWSDLGSRGTAGWREHRDINTVMLATSLAPDTFLLI